MKWSSAAVDFSLPFGDLARFRVSVFRERGNLGIVLRQIPNKLLTLEQIGLPEQVRATVQTPRADLGDRATGSGKPRRWRR